MPRAATTTTSPIASSSGKPRTGPTTTWSRFAASPSRTGTTCEWTHHLKRKGLLDRYRQDLERRLEQLGAHEPSDASFLEPEDSADGFIGQQAGNWLGSYDGEQPFFLHASFCGPHFPVDPPAAYHRHRPEDMPPPPKVQVPDRIRYWQTRTVAYCGMIEQIDDEVGKLLETLTQRGWLDNTLILLTTDHGDMMGHFDQAHKGTPHDTSNRTPIIAGLTTSIPADRQLDGMVESVDLPVTLMDVAGLGPDPEPYRKASPGRSFWGYLKGDTGQPGRGSTARRAGAPMAAGGRCAVPIPSLPSGKSKGNRNAWAGAWSATSGGNTCSSPTLATGRMTCTRTRESLTT